MNDLELLELAAKAAEIEWYGIAADDNNSCVYFDIGPKEIVEWNPLTDDGDALRLAVKLKLELEFGSNFVNVGRSVDVGEWYLAQDSSSDMHSATRRAIVRAAAEIGRRMQHE